MNHTSNYQLSQWAKSDQVKMEDFNADNAKIDAALKAHSTALAGKGNCSVGTFTYTGTGTFGTDGPTVIHFPKIPVFAVVRGDRDEIMFIHTTQRSPMIKAYDSDLLTTDYHWSGSTLYLSHHSSPQFQCNVKGTVYYVVAFYAES